MITKGPIIGNQFFILLPTNNKVQIDDNSLINFTNVGCRQNILEYTKQLIGTPYLWGGKSGLGFDCSGLVQFLYALHGIQIPRDTSMQIKDKRLEEIKESKLY